MTLTGELVVFHLTTEGKQALKDFVSQKGQVSAYVVDQDELGFWIWMPARRAKSPITKVRGADETRPVILLRWDSFSTAVIGYRPKPVRAPERIGFR